MARKGRSGDDRSLEVSGSAGSKDQGLDEAASSRLELGRRDFLKISGTGVGAASLGLGGLGSSGCDPQEQLPILTPDFATTLTRPEDLVLLRFEFVNLQLDSSGQRLIRKVSSSQSYIIVHFQPQHIFEEALLENPTPPAPLEKPVDARIAGPSRVVLKIPADANIPFSGEGLLEALGKFEMNVAPHALPPDAPLVIRPPLLPIRQNGVTDTRSTARTRNLISAGRQISVSSGIEVSQLPSSTIAQQVTQVSVPSPNPPTAMFPTSPSVNITVPAELGSALQALVPKPRPRVPVNGETALELPYRLVLSPHKHGGWKHAKTALAGLKNGRYELWHTRLGVRDAATGQVSEKASYLRAVRAIWSRDDLFNPADPYTYDDYSDGAPIPPYDDIFGDGSNLLNQTPTSLVPADRVEIVHLSSNFRDLGSYKPRPISAHKLMLTTLGGWLDVKGDFTINTPTNLVSWDHKASMGRDYYVKTERKGRLYPWGHFAIKVDITERKFRGPDRNTAYLWRRTFILVREPIRTYPEGWRKFPFQSIHIKTLVTPNLYDVPPGPTPTFIKIDATNAFRFKMEAVDREGNVVQFDAPATWVPQEGNSIPLSDVRRASAPKGAANLYEEYGDQRVVKLSGQRVAYSPNKKSDDTTYETESVLVEGTVQGEQPGGIVFPSVGMPYVPAVGEAKLNVEAIRHLVGQNEPTPFQYHLTYLQHGFPTGPGPHANKGELLFQVKDPMAPIKLNFAKKSDASGGFVAPSLDIGGLSRITGPVSGKLNDVAANKFDPKEALKSIDALIFGVIPLSDIIALVSDAAGGLGSAPNFVTQTVDAVTGFIEDVAALKQRLEEITAKVGEDTSALRNKIDDVLDAINELLGADDLDDAISDAQALCDELSALLELFLATVDNLPDTLLRSFKEDVKRRARSIKDVIGAVKTGLKAFATGLEMAKNLTVKLEWRAPLQKDPLGFFVPNPTNGGFLLAIEARGKQVGDKPAGVDVVAGIENFDVNVFGESAKIVTIPFERLVFKVESGKKPDVDVVFKGGIGFDGVLAFVETLSKLIPSKGFSDPPALDVSAEGIKSSFSLPIPSVSVGVFSLQNISIGAGFEVPFIGNPLSVNFNFCTREEPFVLTVMCIGGGGFFGIKLSPKGMLLLEAAFEARAQLALDFGVASGSVSIAVGVYFRLEEKAGKQEGSLTGYIRIQGKVDVLGLISASITLLLELIYEFSSEKLIGRATLTIEVSIAFFSFSVEVTCERRLAGSNADPTFVDQMAPYTAMLPDGTVIDERPWDEYCDSFLLAA